MSEQEHLPEGVVTIAELIDKYEVPKEYHDALWDAYIAGTTRGFITGTTAAATWPEVRI